MTKLAYVDTETTGLDPDVHEIWEVGLILRDPTVERGDEGYETEWIWQLPVNLGKATDDEWDEHKDWIARNDGRRCDRDGVR